jgi:signal transduction histidine kinase
MGSFRQTGLARTALALLSVTVLALFLPALWRQHASDTWNDNQRESARDSVEFLIGACDPAVDLYRKHIISSDSARTAIERAVRLAHTGGKNTLRYFFLLDGQGFYRANGQSSEMEGKQKFFLNDPKIIDQKREVDLKGRGFLSYQYYDTEKDSMSSRNIYLVYLPDIGMYLGTDLLIRPVATLFSRFYSELRV